MKPTPPPHDSQCPISLASCQEGAYPLRPLCLLLLEHASRPRPGIPSTFLPLFHVREAVFMLFNAGLPAIREPRSGIRVFQGWSPQTCHSSLFTFHSPAGRALSCPRSGFLAFLIESPPAFLPCSSRFGRAGAPVPPVLFASLSISSRPPAAGAQLEIASPRAGEGVRLWKCWGFRLVFAFRKPCGGGLLRYITGVASARSGIPRRRCGGSRRRSRWSRNRPWAAAGRARRRAPRARGRRR